MNENDFFKKLTELHGLVTKIENSVRPRLWRSFVDGMLRGLGSVVGVVLALALLGWILNIAGVIPAFKEQVTTWQELLDRAVPKQLPQNNH